MSRVRRFRLVSLFVIVVLLTFATVASAVARPVAPPPLPPAPVNDTWDLATQIRSLPFTATQDTSGATSSSTDPNCNADGFIAVDSHSVWFAFHQTFAGNVAVSTAGSNYDTVLSVYKVTGNGRTGLSLTQVACDDDAGMTLQSSVAFAADASSSYLILVAAFGSNPGGDLVLNVANN